MSHPNLLGALFARPAARRDAIAAGIVFIACFFVFRTAPIRQVLDSRYAMLLSENLIRYGGFALDRYHLPEFDYRLQWVGGHRYYAFPPGTSLLSVPFVAVMHLFGVSAVGPDGTYNVTGELRLDARQADLLMAAFSVVVFYTARLLLPVRWSLAVTLVIAFGTQVFSTTSRSMWSDTWGIVLVGFACFLLLRAAAGRERLSLSLLATLEALAYLTRPTNALVLVGTAAYVAWTRPKDAWKFLLTSAGWLGLFVLYSWLHFHTILPDYYASGRLQFAAPLSAFFGNLVSPSRGLLVCVPTVVAIGLLLVRYWAIIRFRSLVALAAFVMIGHLVVLAGFIHWWGGYSFGARLTASLIPWLAILAVIAVDGALAARARSRRRPLDVVLAGLVALLCAASIAINSVGAYSYEAQKWNAAPEDIDHATWRLWSWRSPQFLAPFVEPDEPWLPLPVEGLRVGSGEADKYLGRGWPFGEGEYRWTLGHRGSSVRFALAKGGPGAVEIEASPFLAIPKVPEQRIVVSLNGQEIGTAILRERGFSRQVFAVPAGVAKAENLLRLRTPDAASPFSVDGAEDRRELGVAVRVIRWHRELGLEGPFFLLPRGGLRMGGADADKYLERGWPTGEGEFRWTNGRHASVVRFALRPDGPGFLELELRPFLAAPAVAQQRLIVTMNHHVIGTLLLRETDYTTRTLAVPADVPQEENVLQLATPDAVSPSIIDGSVDKRELGFAVRAIRWHREADREGAFLPIPSDGLRVGLPEADAYLSAGWPPGEGEFRWIQGADGGTVRFALASPGPGVLELEARPYLAPPKVPQQRLIVSLNGHDIGSVRLGELDFASKTFAVPGEAVQQENLLRLRTPDAISPLAVDGTPDRRQLGVAVRVIRWQPTRATP